jgi:elongation factor Ts
MEITAEMVKDLRNKTGLGVMDCKQALAACEADGEKAVEWLRKKGLAVAAKKSGRSTSNGLVGSYIHTGGRVGVMVEVNCETDFVARTESFQELVRDIAMQVAAASPLVARREDAPTEALDKEREIYRQQAIAEKKPEKVIDRIVEGKLERWYETYCLVDQQYIKDQDKKVQDIVNEKISELGENIQIRRFVRFVLGEGE